MNLFEFLADYHNFSGVPDSLLSPVVDYLMGRFGISSAHTITANEGNAVGIATGYHLATGLVPVVYLQNSGIGHIINPITSLLREEVYQIPCLFLVGWRGQPQTKDEPQHVFQGQCTLALLRDSGVLCHKLTCDLSESQENALFSLVKKQLEEGNQVALVVEKGALDHLEVEQVFYQNNFLSTRESVLKLLLDHSREDILVSTTGKTSRELYALRESRGEGHEKDFLTVGSMGHASSIALGIALHQPERQIWCIDGDGATLMHMGAMAVLGQKNPPNLIHVLINNHAHESVGGAPTVAQTMDFSTIAQGCGYTHCYTCQTLSELEGVLVEVCTSRRKNAMINGKSARNLVLIQVKTTLGSPPDLGRPKESPKENKKQLMDFLGVG